MGHSQPGEGEAGVFHRGNSTQGNYDLLVTALEDWKDARKWDHRDQRVRRSLAKDTEGMKPGAPG